MQRLLISCIVLLVGAVDILAQSVDSDRCTVWAEPVVYISPDAIQVTTNSMKLLGTFDTVVSADVLTAKVYRLPRTRLFVIASVQYLEHALAEQNPDLISMSLVVSSKRRDDLLAMVAYAEAEVPFETFGTGELEDSKVMTLIKVKGRSMMWVTMSCRQHSRR